jgi:hypothetical protein
MLRYVKLYGRRLTLNSLVFILIRIFINYFLVGLYTYMIQKNDGLIRNIFRIRKKKKR